MSTQRNKVNSEKYEKTIQDFFVYIISIFFAGIPLKIGWNYGIADWLHLPHISYPHAVLVYWLVVLAGGAWRMSQDT